MAGASMFLIFEDSNGNITLSERAGTGHSMPQPVQEDNLTLLSGSGIIDNEMVANIRYQASGNSDISEYNDWIMATKEGASLDSADPDESISIHDSHTAFTVNLSQATITSQNGNPFSESDGGESGSSPPSGGVTEVDNNPNKRLILAHGIILTIVFTGMYPLGSIFMPLVGKWYFHASWQMIAFFVMWAGFGIGYVVSDRLDIVSASLRLVK